MIQAVNWLFHVVVWNMTGTETGTFAETFEKAIKSYLLPCKVTVADMDHEVPESSDVLFSFPTEQGLTARNDVPIMVHIRCRIPYTLTTLQKQNPEIELLLAGIVHEWPNRDKARVFLDITS